jgi:hypothetical protein
MAIQPYNADRDLEGILSALFEFRTATPRRMMVTVVTTRVSLDYRLQPFTKPEDRDTWYFWVRVSRDDGPYEYMGLATAWTEALNVWPRSGRFEATRGYEWDNRRDEIVARVPDFRSHLGRPLWRVPDGPDRDHRELILLLKHIPMATCMCFGNTH